MATSLAGGAGLEAAELAIRRRGDGAGPAALEPLLAADGGYRGPRAGCGAGHQAGFVSYRDKTTGTVLGTVTISRAWYHCPACGHGFAPRDAGLGVAGATMSPGLAKMTGRAAAAVPFAAAARLAGELAGITLTGKRPGAAPKPAARPPPASAIAGQRLKLSGMRWTEHGATGILTLRCLEASDRWHEIPTNSGQTPAA